MPSWCSTLLLIVQRCSRPLQCRWGHPRQSIVSIAVPGRSGSSEPGFIGYAGETFFDDYPMVELLALCSSADAAATFPLRALGWMFAESDDKTKPFCHIFTTLGVQFDMSSMAQGRIILGNKPERQANIVKEIKEVIKGGKLMCADATCRRGRIRYAESDLFGRIS